MPTENILALLSAERDKLNRAIEALEGPTRRRGRPPKIAVNGATPNTAFEPAQPAKKKRRFSFKQRQAAAEKMHRMWAKKRAAAKPQSKGAKPKTTTKAA
jgi:hypothetical protein